MAYILHIGQRNFFDAWGLQKEHAPPLSQKLQNWQEKEAKLFFQHQTVHLEERYSIPTSLIMNFDQTTVKYTPLANQTLKKGSKRVAIKRCLFRQSITATFGINFVSNFLPMQLIYGGKTEKSLPHVNSPDSFCLSTNEKEFTNTQKYLKLIKDIIVP